MKRLIWILITWLGFMLAHNNAYAQSGLCISSIFKEYGSHNGGTMVELSNDMLKNYNIMLYTSITFKDVTPYLPAILQCLDDDKDTNKSRKIQ